MTTMQSYFRAISISYESAPVAIREYMSLNSQQIDKLLDYLKEFSDVQEALVLSTCNRTEVYYTSAEDKSIDIIKLIGIEHQVDSIDKYIPYFKLIKDQAEAVAHLFDVSMGLKSKVVGDIQISNQVKRAYQSSADHQMAGPFLHRLMHTIFFTNKRVIQETTFRDGAASVSYATTEMVKGIVQEFITPRILILGLGEIGKDVCRNLVGSGLEDVTIANRTHQKAIEMAVECGFKYEILETSLTNLDLYDIVISSVACEHPIISENQVRHLNIFSHKYFFDLSVPRSVSDQIDDHPGIIVYNIDDINTKANEALESRIAAVPQVKSIVREAIAEFSTWSSEMTVSPTINKIKTALEDIRQAELAKAIKGSDPKELELVDKVTRNMIQKIIKLPVLQLKAACKRGEAESLIDVLNELFDLEKSKIK